MNLTDYVSVAQLQGFARHAITVAGGALVTGGYVSDNDMAAAAGVAAVIIGIGWSYISKKVKIDDETNKVPVTGTGSVPPSA